ncbi:LOW QUALITY PROTEIN: carboxymuconolactone decarboxylase [Colletotrichum tofieldiae]|nr:LOW QUALITY PROTEIN: carboxymuconolactone decarboxylase [Colletotrichum tofieldiae]
MRIPYVPNPPPTSTPKRPPSSPGFKPAATPGPCSPSTWLSCTPRPRRLELFSRRRPHADHHPADLRELAISRVAVVNRAWYEWGHHAPLAVAAGVSTDAMDAVKAEAPLELGARPALYLSEKQWAVLVYTDEMTRNVRVKDETFDKLKSLFSEREVVEITTTLAKGTALVLTTSYSLGIKLPKACPSVEDTCEVRLNSRVNLSIRKEPKRRLIDGV